MQLTLPMMSRPFVFGKIAKFAHSAIPMPLKVFFYILNSKRTAFFLLSCFTSLKVMMFYFLISKRICLCIAISFAAFSFHNAVRRKNMQIFVRNGPNHKILAHCIKNPNFDAILLHVSSACCNQLENGINLKKL